MQNKGRGLYSELGVDEFGGVKDGEGSAGGCEIDCGGGKLGSPFSVEWLERASTVKGVGGVNVADELDSAGACWRRGSTRARRGSRALRGSICYVKI